MDIICEITKKIKSVHGVQLLHVDSGISTNRTVVTFIGTPEAVVESAFAVIQTAIRLIDMRQHHGEHPRIGAADVCPLIPYTGITMENTVTYARKLAQRVGQELSIPVYCYARAAFIAERRNLATIRSGEYEGLAKKLQDPQWTPDFGPRTFNPKAGATVIGARDILIAYNINLNTTDVHLAREIARDVRESGRMQQSPITGNVIRDKSGSPVRIPGSLKGVKAIGWTIAEYGCCQVSMNLTDIHATPMHIAYDEVCARAQARGIQVTGSELVGMVPLQALLDAGIHAASKHGEKLGTAQDLIQAAVAYLGLNHLKPFKPQKRIIEYTLAHSGLCQG